MKKTISLFLTLLITATLSACNNSSNITFTLLGDIQQNYSVGETYDEAGFNATLGSKDISEYVTVTTNVDEAHAGDYLVTYTLDYEDKIEILQRNVFYRNDGCIVVNGDGTTQCTANYSDYLHTYVKLTIYYDGDTYHNTYGDIFDDVEEILSDYNDLSDKYDSYANTVNVFTINQTPSTTHTIDERLFDMIQYAMDHQDDVDNLFNIALGPVLQVWHDYRELADPFSHTATELPTLAELEAQNQYTDSSKIILDEEHSTITMEENMSIDIGGMSKGYISQVIIDYLNTLDLTAYLLNNGNSNISVGGTHPVRDHGKFILAATDPTGETYPGYATILLGDGDQLVTSGDYQQYFMVDGELYHHIINPNTLFPERYTRSVSIVTTEHAGLADLYSTAIFTMTLEEGLAFVNSTDNLEAIWYGIDDEITFSENFEELYLGELF